MKKLIISAIFLILLFSCKKDKIIDNHLTNGKDILISNSLYADSPNDYLLISNAVIENDSLKISFSASCCSGKNWVIGLVGSADILYSDPPQRLIRLSLENTEACLAVCGRTAVFNLEPAQIQGGVIILDLQGWGSLKYNY
jgi:hypothetical protein